MTRLSVLLCVAVVAGARRHVESDLQHLSAGPFPCELKVKYGQGKDFDDQIVDSITLIADCKADVHDCWLDQPFLEKKDNGRTVSIQIEGKGEDKGVVKAGLSSLRTLRLVDDLEDASYVGRTFTFRGKDAAGDEGSATVTIQEPAAAKAAEQAAKEAGGLPCELSAVAVDLQGGGHGFKILVKCTEEVSDLKLSVPKPYRDIRPLIKVGALNRLMVVDASKLQGQDFALTGRSASGVEGSASVTVPVIKADKADEPAPKEDQKVQDSQKVEERGPKKEPTKPGSLPCTLKQQEVTIEGGSGKGVELTIKCTAVVTNPKLKWGASPEELSNESGLQGPLKADVESELVLDKDGLEGMVFVLEGEANGVLGATEPVHV